MKKLITKLKKQIASCAVSLPWLTSGMEELDAKYDKMCAAFHELADDLRKHLEEK
jgi:hypothetical protein